MATLAASSLKKARPVSRQRILLVKSPSGPRHKPTLPSPMSAFRSKTGSLSPVALRTQPASLQRRAPESPGTRLVTLWPPMKSLFLMLKSASSLASLLPAFRLFRTSSLACSQSDEHAAHLPPPRPTSSRGQVDRRQGFACQNEQRAPSSRGRWRCARDARWQRDSSRISDRSPPRRHRGSIYV